KPELDTVMLGLSDFPQGLLPLEKNRQLIHAPRGLDNGRTMANAVINIFDAWNDKSPEYQRSTIFHEIAHVFASQSKMDESEKWLAKSGWEKTVQVIDGEEVSNSQALFEYTIVSEYGKSSEWEDFAESVVAYR